MQIDNPASARKRLPNCRHSETFDFQSAGAKATERRSERIQEFEPFHRNTVKRRFAEAVNKAVASAEVAYKFNAGSYTAQALSDVLAIRTMLKWLHDLGEAAK
jgi:hypothetical protein